MIKKIIASFFTLILLVFYCSPNTFAYESLIIGNNQDGVAIENKSESIYEIVEGNPSCGQWGFYDDETMTLSGIYENTLIRDYVRILEGNEHPNSVFFKKDGNHITDGNIEEGMVVQIYRNGELYGEYTVSELWELAPAPDSLQNNKYGQYSIMSSAYSNAYGFTLPIDNMNLILRKDSTLGNISSPFGYRKSPITGLAEGHNGIDISWDNINGTEIKAVKDGTVTESRYQFNEEKKQAMDIW
ncbi:MAG TPA: hypothetical protein GX723_13560 [Thermoanaerobacterales bacterium]|nr:hypothetical protein [Thermoanaerobacterales bacterium]